ncbi:MAG: ankyrin repeat domain-containing protein [Alphaproteobacteria bacterium]|nr:ankyrin repeat domain-containing protein [Alphaproteobacteria bacterium]MBY0500553.1 ankyrin repeat domain-containing protein [Alphaproteobacteria bacterium]
MKFSVFKMFLYIFCIITFFNKNVFSYYNDKEKSNFIRAVKKGTYERVKKLYNKNNSLVHVRDEQGRTIMHIAQAYDQTKKIKFLAKHVPELIETPAEGLSKSIGTPLHYAAQNGDMKELKTLLKYVYKYDLNVDCLDANGDTPLHVAIKNSEDETVQYLIEEGADVDCLDANGDTPLHIAIKNSEDKIAQSLIEEGADTSLRSKGGKGKSVSELAKKYTTKIFQTQLFLDGGKQQDGKKPVISEKKWQVCLFFTDGSCKTLNKIVPHANIAFEGLDKDGITHNFYYVHLTEKGVIFKKGKHALDTARMHTPRNAFRWSIEKKTGLNVLKKIKKDKKTISLGVFEAGENNVHSCMTYALKVLRECGIKYELRNIFGRVIPSTAIEDLHSSKR